MFPCKSGNILTTRKKKEGEEHEVLEKIRNSVFLRRRHLRDGSVRGKFEQQLGGSRGFPSGNTHSACVQWRWVCDCNPGTHSYAYGNCNSKPHRGSHGGKHTDTSQHSHSFRMWRVLHSDADVHVNADGNADKDLDADHHRDAYSNCDSNADPDGDQDIPPGSDEYACSAYGDRNSGFHSDCNADSHEHPDAYGNSDSASRTGPRDPRMEVVHR